MIKVDESDPIGELEPSFPYRDVSIKRNMDMKEYYDLETEIGRGKFGTVYRCREKSTGLTLAAKFVGIARRQDRRNVEREVEIMRSLQHPRLIQLYDAFEVSNVMCVIQELIEGGELFERVIDDDFILTEKSCTVFMRQICEGVEFIHSQNILHLDLKPENILCLTKTGNRIKIIDFGLARKFEPDKKLQVLFGTPEFVAPEVVNFDQIGFGTDMWSVGVICYVLLSGLSPFMGETDVETMANVTIAQYDFDDDAFDDISEDAKTFISKLLMKNKEQRSTATECLSHSWLRRKPPPPLLPQPPPPQPVRQTKTGKLAGTKENLRSFVDRWSEQATSPTKIATPVVERIDTSINTPMIITVVPPIDNDNKINNKGVEVRSTEKGALSDTTIENNKLNNKGVNIRSIEKERMAMEVDNEKEIAVQSEFKRSENTKTDNKSQNISSNVLSGPSIVGNNVVDVRNTVIKPEETKAVKDMKPQNNRTGVNLKLDIKTDSVKVDERQLPRSGAPKVDANANKPLTPQLPSPSQPPGIKLGTIPKISSSSKLKTNTTDVNKVSDLSVPSPPTRQPSPPIESNTGMIRKTPSGSKLKSDALVKDPNQKSPVPQVPSPTQLRKSPSPMEIDVSHKISDLKTISDTSIPHSPLSSVTNVNDKSFSQKNSVINSPSGGSLKEEFSSKELADIQNESRNKLPEIRQMPINVKNKPKLVSQTSEPDLSKCVLHRNIPETKPRATVMNSSANNNISSRTSKQTEADGRKVPMFTLGSRSDVKQGEQSGADIKLNKTLTKHVPPKIHGITLGQVHGGEGEEDQAGPKVITHKIHIEGRTEPLSPTSKENTTARSPRSRSPKPIGKSSTVPKLELTVDNSTEAKVNMMKYPFARSLIETDRFDLRRGSDISCFLHNSENMERVSLSDEIKKLSSRLFQMANDDDDEPENSALIHNLPASSFRNDPIGRFLANHGVISRRPKYRMSNLNRDVPIGSPPPASNLFYHLSHSNSGNWSDNQTHSAPQSPSSSPEREPGALSRNVILRLFDKSSDSKKEGDGNLSTTSSIDSLASYFNKSNSSKTKTPPVVTSK